MARKRKTHRVWSNKEQQIKEIEGAEPHNPYRETFDAGPFTSTPKIQPHEEASVEEDRQIAATLGFNERDTEAFIKVRLLGRRRAEHIRQRYQFKIGERVARKPGIARPANGQSADDGSVSERDLRALREWATKCIYNYSWLASGLVEILCQTPAPQVDLRQAAESHRRLAAEFSAPFLQAAFDFIEVASHQFSTAVELPDFKRVATKFTVPPTTTEYEIGKRIFPTAHEGARWLNREASTLVGVLESADFQLVPVADDQGVSRLSTSVIGADGAVRTLLLDYQPLDVEQVDRLRVGIHDEWRRAVALVQQRSEPDRFASNSREPAEDSIPPVVQKPQWDAHRGELRFGVYVRQVARQAKRIRRVLTEFEKAGWPTKINSPFPDDPDCASRCNRRSK